MTFLVINNQCITNPVAGVARSLCTIAVWLAEAGHTVHVLTTSRFEAAVEFTIDEHLQQLGIDRSESDNEIHYRVGEANVTLLLTQHHDESNPDFRESAIYLRRFRQLVDRLKPDQIIASGGHSMIREAMAHARARAITTAFAVRGYGYYEPNFFEHVDHAFTCGEFLTDFYRDKCGLISTPLEPPIDWSTTVAPNESRTFLTFVHPAPHKGAMLFARLAEMLGARRPDIPILVVQSGRSAGMLNAIPGIDFSRYPQIQAAPAVAAPAAYLGLTRALLVPSVWEEPFGRVAAEAMINGIPALVSDRGALPGVIGGDASDGGGGFVLPVPAWMTRYTQKLPSEQDLDPWYRAVCRLWDDDDLYERVSDRARQIGAERYNEPDSRDRHLRYFTSLKPGAGVFTTPPGTPPRSHSRSLARQGGSGSAAST